MKFTVLLSTAALISSVLAADSPYIPSGISQGCADVLAVVDADPSFGTCLSNLNTAMNAFSGSSNASWSDVTTALGSLCSSSACQNGNTRTLLTSLYGACTDEMTSGNTDVVALYDVMYTFTPFRSAVCSKDSSTGDYCVSSIASDSSSSKRSLLAVRDDSLPEVDADKMRSSNEPYLFMTADSKDLCTPCGKSILQSYVTWEGTIPYALGLSQSPILGGQSDLWETVKTKCGQGFLDTITADSGAAPLAALASGDAIAQIGRSNFAALLALAGVTIAIL